MPEPSHFRSDAPIAQYAAYQVGAPVARLRRVWVTGTTLSRQMKLPGAGTATIDSAKLRDYLLSASHPVGRFKATFFASLGYTPAQCGRLQGDLHALACAEEAVTGLRSPYGQKYEVRGTLLGPNGRTAEVVTVWIILVGEEAPRFVTAFPGGKA